MSVVISKIEYCDAKNPTVRYNAGLTLFDETFLDGRWLHQYWSPIGRINPEPVLYGQAGMELLSNRAFALNIDGQDLHRGWEFVGFTKQEEAKEFHCHGVVALRHTSRPVELKVHTVTDSTVFLKRWLEVTNTSDRPAVLSGVSPWAGRVFPSQVGLEHFREFEQFDTVNGGYRLGYFTGRYHSDEGYFRWHELDGRTVEIGENTGKSGWGHPIAYLQNSKAGEIFVLQIQWSGGWFMRFQPHQNPLNQRGLKAPMLFAEAGPKEVAPLRILAPGETVTSPAVHVGGMIGGMNEIVQQLHDHHRKSVYKTPPAGSANLVSYNHWSYMHHELSEEKLLHEIDIAADLGAEVFTIDAGWYGLPGQDWRKTGHWRPGDRLPNGLGPIWSHARKKGLKCGLWCWIESVDLDNPLIREHPDWLIHIDGKPKNAVLDLAKPDVANWVESELIRIVEEYEIDLFRLDYNEYPNEGGFNVRDGFEENTVWRHYEAMYGIWDRVSRRFPNLVLENCAGGGARTDIGMLSQMHFTWISDYALAPRTIRMQNAFLLALGPEVLARFSGVVMNGHLGGDLDMQMRMTFILGNPCLSGIWPTLHDKHAVAYEKIVKAVDLFKTHIRPMITTCKVYHHDIEILGDYPKGWCTIEYAARDASKDILAVFRMAGNAEGSQYVIPRGIDRSKTYRITSMNTEHMFEMSGAELAHAGVRVPLPSPMTSEVLILESCCL